MEIAESEPVAPLVTDVWTTLAGRLDYAAFVPTPNPAIERSDLHRGDSTPYIGGRGPS